ncbi:MAG: ATP synthase F1 subunit epsilon [Candidatus Dormiibacterota bacterium]
MAIRVRVLAADRPLLEGEADFLTFRGADGDLGVLPQHAPLLTWLKPGEVMVRQGERETYLFIEGGFLEVLPQLVTVLAERGQSSSELNLEAVEEDRRALQERLTRGGEPEAAQLRSALDVAEARVAAAQLQRRRDRE